MNKYITKTVDKVLDLDIQELVHPDKCTLPQVRNAMNMNDNIADNAIKMMITKSGAIAILIIVGGIVFKMIEPNITNIILAKNSKELETNKEEE